VCVAGGGVRKWDYELNDRWYKAHALSVYIYMIIFTLHGHMHDNVFFITLRTFFLSIVPRDLVVYRRLVVKMEMLPVVFCIRSAKTKIDF
jgi:hypothetical protein